MGSFMCLSVKIPESTPVSTMEGEMCGTGRGFSFLSYLPAPTALIYLGLCLELSGVGVN
jgi:hypothetical protein